MAKLSKQGPKTPTPMPAGHPPAPSTATPAEKHQPAPLSHPMVPAPVEPVADSTN